MCKLIINFLIRNTWIYHKMVVIVSVKVGFFILISYFVKKTIGLLIFHGHWGCLNNPIFWNLGSCAACWAQFMYHHKYWPTSVSHPFSFLNSSLGLTGGKITWKLLFISLGLFFKISHFQARFFILVSIAIFYPDFILVGLLLQYVALFQSGN